jgi:hypothetical protein
MEKDIIAKNRRMDSPEGLRDTSRRMPSPVPRTKVLASLGFPCPQILKGFDYQKQPRPNITTRAV